MGHVDHGKTTLLDCLRHSNLAAREPGGITQHLGAFTVRLSGDTGNASCCFLDTPGHAAFKAVRERGATATDMVILMVALDDGIMPQTLEVVQLARERALPIIVAMSKADLCVGDLKLRRERIAEELFGYGIDLEGFSSSGSVQSIAISAINGSGIKDLIRCIAAEAEMLTEDALLFDESKAGSGYVLETKKSIGLGDVASAVLKDGCLSVGDWMVAGGSHGRVRQIYDEWSRPLRQLRPSIPALISGWKGCPPAGEEIVAVSSEDEARELCGLFGGQLSIKDNHTICAKRRAQNKTLLHEHRRKLCDRSQRIVKVLNMDDGDDKEKRPVLSVLIKADTLGSLDAIKQAFASIPQGRAKIDIIDGGSIGQLSANDLELALCRPNPLIVSFNQGTKNLSIPSSIKFLSHNIIYSLVDEVTEALRKLLPPERSVEVVGEATVRQLFQIDGKPPQMIAGCAVHSGTLQNASRGGMLVFRIVRRGAVLYEGPLKSMRHGKSEVKTVQSGMECGLGFDHGDILPGDIVQQLRVTLVEPQLGSAD